MEETSPAGYLLDPDNVFQVIVGDDGSYAVYQKIGVTIEDENVFASEPTVLDLDTGHLFVENSPPTIGSPSKYLNGGAVISEGDRPDYDPNRGDLPYLMDSSQEILTYRIEVPIDSTEGYLQLLIYDYLDPLLAPIFGSWKTYVLETGAAVSGIYDISSTYMRFVKADEFSQIPPNSTLVLEFQAQLNGTLEQLYAAHPDGIVENYAAVQLNRGALHYSNTVAAQALRGSMTLTKTIEGAPMPGSLEAAFDLYMVVGSIDDDINGETDDIFINDYRTVYDAAFEQSILQINSRPRPMITSRQRKNASRASIRTWRMRTMTVRLNWRMWLASMALTACWVTRLRRS